MAKEANRDGSISDGLPYTEFDEIAELTKFFSNLDWEFRLEDRGIGGYYQGVLLRRNINITAHLYVKKLTNGGRDNRLTEKRLQASANIDRRGFIAPSSRNVLKAIIAIYGNSNYPERIICGWNIDEWGQNEEKAFNCFIDIQAVADAFIYGMRKHTSSRGQISYAFKPEFLIYYLFNSNDLFLESQSQYLEPTEITPPQINIPKNCILFGAPGTGKSSKIQHVYSKGHKKYRVTFHPDYDYASFVGAYKPATNDEGDIIYHYEQQEFIRAYINAWNDPDHAHFLIIEEINRGNCAQIFGDLFQSLDRDSEGFSEYEVDTDADLSKHLKAYFDNNLIAAQRLGEQLVKRGCLGNAYGKIILPNNLYLYATMNTSDQSLFPMDSAFKRRWDWEYIPIEYSPKDKNGNWIQFEIFISEDARYSWATFIEKVNKRIYEVTQNDDKQIGYFFVKPTDQRTITKDVFKTKVMFYLWYEVFKHEMDSKNIFKYFPSNSNQSEFKPFSFSQLFNISEEDRILKSFMENLEVDNLIVGSTAQSNS